MPSIISWAHFSADIPLSIKGSFFLLGKPFSEIAFNEILVLTKKGKTILIKILFFSYSSLRDSKNPT